VYLHYVTLNSCCDVEGGENHERLQQRKKEIRKRGGRRGRKEKDVRNER
jgi:hypothetical protein